MQKRMIKSVKQLPAWFKLEDYQLTHTMNANDWYDQLTLRFFLKNALQHHPERAAAIWKLATQKGDLDSEEKLEQALQELGSPFGGSEKGPIDFKLNFISERVHRLQLIPADAEPEEPYCRAVDSMTNLMMYSSYLFSNQAARDDILDKIKGLFDSQTGERAKNPNTDALAWSGQPFDQIVQDIRHKIPFTLAYAYVDLDASDEQIKEQFAQWLTQERRRRNVPADKKHFNQHDFQGFYESAVLPYLDLMFWATMEKVKINQYVIAQAIFPDAYAPGSEVDPLGKLKTTKKKADYLMKYETLRHLELQTTGFKPRDNDLIIKI